MFRSSKLTLQVTGPAALTAAIVLGCAVLAPLSFGESAQTAGLRAASDGLRAWVAEPDPGAPPSPSATTTPPPAPVAPPAAATSTDPGPSPEESLADQKLVARLTPLGADPTIQSRMLLGVAWDPNESAATKAAALRRLKQMDPRVIAEESIPALGMAPPVARIGMMDLIAGLYTRLGGVYSSLDVALSDQIRSLDPSVSRAAIETCSRLGVRNAYLPLREVASRPGAPLREEAIAALARLSDPRAVPFFKKLLDENSAPRDEIYQALGQLGRPSALLLKSKLDDADAQERRRALDALLPIATAEDLSGLYAYIQKHPPEGELKKKIYDVIATLESQSFERPLGTGD